MYMHSKVWFPPLESPSPQKVFYLIDDYCIYFQVYVGNLVFVVDKPAYFTFIPINDFICNTLRIWIDDEI